MSLNPAMKVFGIVSQELSEVMRTVNVTSCFFKIPLLQSMMMPLTALSVLASAVHYAQRARL